MLGTSSRVTAGTLALLTITTSCALAPERSLSTAEILEREGGAVLMIETRDKQGQLTGQASGVVIGPGGAIVTNLHVLEGACSLGFRFSSRGEPVEVASVIRVDKDNDLALLRVNGETPPPATIGRSTQLKVGDSVVAIGNPMGLERSVSEGIVSGIRDFGIQVTAPISPGSSGGGLYNRHGQLVGFTSFTLRESQNLNFAIPVEGALELLASQPGSAEMPWSTASKSFCKEATSGLDSGLIVGILGLPLADPAVRDLLNQLNDGKPQNPVVERPPGGIAGGDYRSYQFLTKGVVLEFVDGVARSAHLYGGKGFHHFTGTLPFGLHWSASRSAVIGLLGPPRQTGNFHDYGAPVELPGVRCPKTITRCAVVTMISGTISQHS